MEGHISALDEAIKRIHWNQAVHGLGRKNTIASHHLSLLPKTFQWLPPPKADLFQVFVKNENLSPYFEKVHRKLERPRKKVITDADVVWHNAVLHNSRKCGWERNRLQWLSDLEGQSRNRKPEQKPSETNLFCCCFPFFT